jgi:hypothetical protein
LPNDLKAAALNAAVHIVKLDPEMNRKQKARELARATLDILAELERLEDARERKADEAA